MGSGIIHLELIFCIIGSCLILDKNFIHSDLNTQLAGLEV